YADSPDPELRKIILHMTASMLAQTTDVPGGMKDGFMIKSLMTSARVLDDPSALKLAGLQTHKAFGVDALFAQDMQVRPMGHMHGSLRTLVGCAGYALYTGDPVLFSRVDAAYRYVRAQGTRFGFLPEVVGRQGDVVATETCALMAYVGL